MKINNYPIYNSVTIKRKKKYFLPVKETSFIITVLLFLISGFSHAATYYSVNTGNASNFCYGVWSGTSGGAACCCTPLTTDNVVIEGGYTITLNLSYAIQNITIRSGSTFVMTGGTTLNVKGNWTNNGTFTPGTNTIALMGTGNTQTLTGATTFYNLTLNNTFATAPQMVLANNILVTNTLTLTNGKIALGASNLTIGTASSTSPGITGYPAYGTVSTRYIITNGAGSLIQKNMGFGGVASNVIFPVGYNTTSYTPVSLNNSAGVPDDFSVRISNGVYSTPPSTGIITTEGLNKTYNISEAVPGGSNVVIKLQWNTAEENIGFNRLSCAVTHYTSGSWIYTQALASAGSGVGPFTRISSGNTSFSPYSVASSDILPINLLKFEGSIHQGLVKLEWTTSTESHNDYFTVQRSIDGSSFEDLVKIKGSGNSSTNLNYSFIDENPREGISYYRLKQTDVDAKSSCSNLISILFRKVKKFEFAIFPNPSDGIEIRFAQSDQINDKEVVVVLYDSFGNEVYSNIILTFNSVFFSATDPYQKLLPGVYLVTGRTDNEMYHQKLVVK